jgi:hypothetical protein
MKLKIRKEKGEKIRESVRESGFFICSSSPVAQLPLESHPFPITPNPNDKY